MNALLNTISEVMLGSLALLAGPMSARAQIAAPTPPAPPATAPDSAGGGVVLALIGLVGLLLLLGVTVKLYDAKRRRDDDALVLQARLSDALMRDSQLSGIPVVASVHMGIWRASPPIVELSGVVPSTEVRERVLEIVQHEPASARASITERIAVDPLRFRQAA